MIDGDSYQIYFPIFFQDLSYCIILEQLWHTQWWVKPQVHGSTEVVKREYRSNKELFNLINF